jgi:hypothetical protein
LAVHLSDHDIVMEVVCLDSLSKRLNDDRRPG